MLLLLKVFGVKKISSLKVLPYVELPAVFVLDNLHGLHLGIAKDIAGYWFRSENHDAEFYVPLTKVWCVS